MSQREKFIRVTVDKVSRFGGTNLNYINVDIDDISVIQSMEFMNEPVYLIVLKNGFDFYIKRDAVSKERLGI